MSLIAEAILLAISIALIAASLGPSILVGGARLAFDRLACKSAQNFTGGGDHAEEAHEPVPCPEEAEEAPGRRR